MSNTRKISLNDSLFLNRLLYQSIVCIVCIVKQTVYWNMNCVKTKQKSCIGYPFGFHLKCCRGLLDSCISDWFFAYDDFLGSCWMDVHNNVVLHRTKTINVPIEVFSLCFSYFKFFFFFVFTKPSFLLYFRHFFFRFLSCG